MVTQSTTREQRAQALIDAGAVTLLVGQGVAEVKGSKGATYRVTSTGCECPDSQRRQVDCKHVLATKALCAEFHRLKVAAELGERIRPSTALLQALRWPTKATGCRECGKPTRADVCVDCFFGTAA